MQLTLWNNFSKRKNSTKRPLLEEAALTIDVKLKENVSIESPVFIMETVLLEVNYCLWNDHYYYIDDIIILSNNLCEIHCSQDVLATFKDSINAYGCFVERSESSYDPLLDDNLVSSSENVVLSTRTVTAITGIDDESGGCYIVKIMGRDGIKNFLFPSLDSIANLYNIAAYVGDDLFNIESLVRQIGIAAFNVSQYVLSVMYCPFPITSLPHSSVPEEVWCGFFYMRMHAYSISTPYISRFQSLNVPNNQYNDFRKFNSKFTRLNILLPSVGTINLNPIDIQSGLDLRWCFDINTGTMSYELSSNNRIVSICEGQFGVPMQIGAGVPSGSILSDVSKSVTDVISGNVVGGLVNSVNSMIQSTPSIIGSQGNVGRVATNPYIIISLCNMESKDVPVFNAGRPLFKNVVLGTLTGFVKCGNASIDIEGLSNDKDMINSYLNYGIYLE